MTQAWEQELYLTEDALEKARKSLEEGLSWQRSQIDEDPYMAQFPEHVTIQDSRLAIRVHELFIEWLRGRVAAAAPYSLNESKTAFADCRDRAFEEFPPRSG